ncbi:degenerin del-1-like [Tropilaelaps mercedesae]|uniref:Degenerin del-1-like n=1 Tax=Tropilaelaps mercedesae TaxID=418985 RepID=A0A1V9X4M9_9ACAR|nr:degenerin del-1-like [Tropilaelaps mercedesae]
MYNVRRTLDVLPYEDSASAGTTRSRRRYNFSTEISYLNRSDEYSRILARNLKKELEKPPKGTPKPFSAKSQTNIMYLSPGGSPKKQPFQRLCGLFQPVFLLRFLITILCVVGFVYQSADFFIGFFHFPTTTNIRVESMKDLVFPSLTVCVANWVSRKKVCEIDELHRKLCGDESPTQETLIDSLWNRASISDVAFSTEELIGHCHMKPTSGCEPFDCGQHWQFAYSRFPDAICYSLDLHAIGDPYHPLNRCKYPWDYELNVSMGWKEQETLQISDMYKADAVLHQVETNSAGQLHPLFFEPGARYIILVEQFTTLALPPPYQTQCVDYDSMPQSKMFYGKTTQNLCYEMCKADFWNSYCNCVSPRYAYRDRYPRVCTQAETSECAKTDIDHRFTDQCIQKCRQPCKEITYEVQVTAQGQKEGKVAVGASNKGEDDYYEDDGQPTDSTNDTEVTGPTRKYFSLTVMFASEKHTVLQHMRKFTFIEVFGYLGGYVGIWLGMSFFSVLDNFIVYLRKQ